MAQVIRPPILPNIRGYIRTSEPGPHIAPWEDGEIPPGYELVIYGRPGRPDGYVLNARERHPEEPQGTNWSVHGTDPRQWAMYPDERLYPLIRAASGLEVGTAPLKSPGPAIISIRTEDRDGSVRVGGMRAPHLRFLEALRHYEERAAGRKVYLALRLGYSEALRERLRTLTEEPGAPFEGVPLGTPAGGLRPAFASPAWTQPDAIFAESFDCFGGTETLWARLPEGGVLEALALVYALADALESAPGLSKVGNTHYVALHLQPDSKSAILYLRARTELLYGAK